MTFLGKFVKTKSTGYLRYAVEQLFFLLLQMIPALVGIAFRGVLYKPLIKSDGFFGIEENVQLCHAKNLRLGKNVFIGRNAYIGASGGGIELGDNVCLLDGCYLNVFNYFRPEPGSSKIVIGEDAVLSHGCVIHGHSGVKIGKKTIVGPGTIFISGDHGDIKLNTDYRTVQVTNNTPVIVGDNVWIGANVTILPGVTVGDHAVIGAGAVVTKDVPPNSIYAGNPARLLRMIG